jgi:RNA polymerase sigma factor (sigma-70 family)
MTARTDFELLRAAGKDAAAFRELYDRYAEPIFRFHLGRTHDRESALDLTAETFAQAWLSRNRFRDLADGSASPWLYTIARRTLVASIRKGRLERSAVERLGVLLERDPEQAGAPEDARSDGVAEAVADLPRDVREALTLRVVHELPYDDVGRTVGTTAGTARVRVHRALTALRNRLLETKEASR